MKPTTHLAIAFCVVGFFLSVHLGDFVFEILEFVVGTIGVAAIQFAPHIGVEAVQITNHCNLHHPGHRPGYLRRSDR